MRILNPKDSCGGRTPSKKSRLHSFFSSSISLLFSLWFKAEPVLFSRRAHCIKPVWICKSDMLAMRTMEAGSCRGCKFDRLNQCCVCLERRERGRSGRRCNRGSVGIWRENNWVLCSDLVPVLTRSADLSGANVGTCGSIPLKLGVYFVGLLITWDS